MPLYAKSCKKIVGPYAEPSSGAALALQRRLHLHGLQMVILPMKI